MVSLFFLGGLEFWASLFASEFVQVTLTSFQKLFTSSQHRGEKMVARFDFLPNFLWCMGGDVDLSSEALLRLAERRRQVSET